MPHPAHCAHDAHMSRGIQCALHLLHAGYVMLLDVLGTGPRLLLCLLRSLGLLGRHTPPAGRVEQAYARDVDGHAQRGEGPHLGAWHVPPRYLGGDDAEVELLREVEELHLHTQRSGGGSRPASGGGWRVAGCGAVRPSRRKPSPRREGAGRCAPPPAA
eukprot:scaffold12183_cov68-Phaeocystis_antarctica.AAC.6